MRTPDMSDEELDRLFQRGAEAYPDEVSLSGWLKLEEQLGETARQQQLRQQVRRRVARLFVAEVALVVLLALCWQLLPDQAPWQRTDTRTANKRPGHSQAGREANPAVPVQPGPTAPAAEARSSTVTASGPTPAAPAAAQETAASAATEYAMGNAAPAAAALPVPGQRLRRPPTMLLASATSNEPSTTSVNASSEKAASRGAVVASNTATTPTVATTATNFDTSAAAAPVTGVPAAAGAALGSDTPLLAAAGAQPTAGTGASVAPADAFPNASAPTPDSTAAPAAVTAPAADTSRIAPLRLPLVYRWLVGVQGAPAFSAVRTAQTARLGGDVGLTLEYRLTSRWRMRTGLRRSVKRYAAASSNYTAPAAWGWRPGTYDVNANCRITEIPLDLRYDLLSRPTYRLFTSLGLTSLLMRNERYNYDYQVNGQTRTLAARVVNGAVHPFGALSISAGIERAWGSRWAGQVEPYVQLPLGEVGAGQVRLSSAGLLFGVKYGLFRPRTVTP